MTDAERNCPDFSLGYQAAHAALARWFKRRPVDEPAAMSFRRLAAMIEGDRKWLEN